MKKARDIILKESKDKEVRPVIDICILDDENVECEIDLSGTSEYFLKVL